VVRLRIVITGGTGIIHRTPMEFDYIVRQAGAVGSIIPPMILALKRTGYSFLLIPLKLFTSFTTEVFGFGNQGDLESDSTEVDGA